jgi:arginine decarboxylase-like protein
VATLNNIKKALLACNGNKMDLNLILVSFLYTSLTPLLILILKEKRAVRVTIENATTC